MSSGASRHFASRGGLALFRRSWSRHGSPRRVALLVHGLAEHSGRYAEFAEFLVGRGFSVHAYDQRGHGESEGVRADTPSFAHLVDDLERFVELVRREESDAPLTLIGHSAGALVAGMLLAKRTPEIAAAVLVAPPLGLPRWWGTPLETLGRVALAIAPRLRVATGVEPGELSRDPDVVAAYVGDPKVSFRMSLRMGTALLDGIDDFRGRAAQIRVPVLVAHGVCDTLSPSEAVRRFAAELTAPGSELVSYPDMRHEILNERGRAAVHRDLATWIEARVPAAGRAEART